MCVPPCSGKRSWTRARSSCCGCWWRPRRNSASSPRSESATRLVGGLEAAILACHAPLVAALRDAIETLAVLALALGGGVTPVLAPLARHLDAGALVHHR